jgi:hypothetical protein
MTQRIPESVSIWLLDWSVVTIMGKLRHLSYSRFNKHCGGRNSDSIRGWQARAVVSPHNIGGRSSSDSELKVGR